MLDDFSHELDDEFERVSGGPDADFDMDNIQLTSNTKNQTSPEPFK